MSNIRTFNHPVFGELPVIVVDGVEWFGASEAAKSLSFTNPRAAIKNHVEEDDVTVHDIIDSLGRKQNKNFVNESGLYSLIIGAAKQGNNLEIREKAKQFKRWVTSEVLPSIRKNGGYIATNENDSEEDILARAVLLAHKTIEKKNQEIAEQKKQLEVQEPLVSFAKICMQSNKSIKVGELAKMMKSHGIDTGQNRLFNKLRDWGLIFKNSTEPTQKAVESGLFEIAQGVKQKDNGEAFTWLTPYVTPKGQLYIVNRLEKEVS